MVQWLVRSFGIDRQTNRHLVTLYKVLKDFLLLLCEFQNRNGKAGLKSVWGLEKWQIMTTFKSIHHLQFIFK